MKTRILAATAALLLTTAALSVAYAQQAQPGNPARSAPAVERSVTKEQFAAKQAEHFALLDANKDGTVTPEEVTAFREAERSKRMLARFDANKDGVVDAAEFAAFADRQFIRMDRNDDGILDRGDMRMAMRDGGHDRHGPKDERGEKGEGRHHGHDEDGPRWHHRGDTGAMDGLMGPISPVQP